MKLSLFFVYLAMPVKVRKQKIGKTVFDVRVQYGNVRVQKTVPTTITEARRVESRILQDLIQGRFEVLQNRQDPTFKQYAKEYKESVTWQKSYKRTMVSVNHLIKAFGKKRLTQITAHDFINYRTMRLQEVGVATINREHTCLARMLNIAVNSDEFLISKNPLKGIKKFKEPPAENRVLSIEEYHMLLESAPEYFRRIIFMACHTGMRKMEILNLAFGQIRVWFNGAEIELIETKSGEKEYVPLDEEVVELLSGIAAERGIDLTHMSPEERKQKVFTGSRGQPLQSVRKPMLRTFEKAGIEPRPFHTFRHFWTKMMFESGNDPATIQKVGRWRDFQTMLKYCYTTKSQEREAVGKLAGHLKTAAKLLPWRQYNGNAEKNAKSG